MPIANLVHSMYIVGRLECLPNQSLTLPHMNETQEVQRLTRLLAASLLLEYLREDINKAAAKYSRRPTQHVCQHTEEGEDACDQCSIFGTLPTVSHITVVGPDRKSASHFSRFWNSVSKISFSSTVAEETAEAVTRGLSYS